MKYVWDASVALKWVLVENDSTTALKIRVDYERNVHELIAPDIFPAECGHGLARAERKAILAPGDSVIHLADILTTLPQLQTSLPLMLRAAEIASRMRTGLYDCIYVALAEREHCELLTADAKLARTFADFPIALLGEVSFE